jgi:hypothetical protein
MAKRTLKNKTKSKTRSKSKRSRRQRGGAKITVNYRSDGMDRSVVLDIADTSTFRELEAKLKEHIKPNLFRKFYHVHNMNSPIGGKTAFTAEVFAKTMPAILAITLLKEEDITSIRKEKPVASLNSGHDTQFNSNWPVYTEAEQKFVLDKLTARLGYEIAVRHQEGSGYIFYSVPHLTHLCYLFDDKTIDECFETYFPPAKAPSEHFDFIYLAFGDIFKPKDHVDASMKITRDSLTHKGKGILATYIGYPDEMFAAAAAAPGGGGE